MPGGITAPNPSGAEGLLGLGLSALGFVVARELPGAGSLAPDLFESDADAASAGLGGGASGSACASVGDTSDSNANQRDNGAIRR